jgi:hypothetical protein
MKSAEVPADPGERSSASVVSGTQVNTESSSRDARRRAASAAHAAARAGLFHCMLTTTRSTFRASPQPSRFRRPNLASWIGRTFRWTTSAGEAASSKTSRTTAWASRRWPMRSSTEFSCLPAQYVTFVLVTLATQRSLPGTTGAVFYPIMIWSIKPFSQQRLNGRSVQITAPVRGKYSAAPRSVPS